MIVRSLLFTLLSYAPSFAQAPVIAAASDLKFAMEDVADLYQVQTGNSLRLIFGATGTFARQIESGAPFDLFMAADEQFVFDLARRDLLHDAGVLYAEGRLALIIPNGSPLALDASLSDLANATKDGRLTRFAIANPAHAPYGQRAQEVLKFTGLWDDLQPFIILGENASQAAQFAVSGNTDGGLIAHALALAAPLTNVSNFTLIPSEWHAPLYQRMALLPNPSSEAQAIYDYLQTPDAQVIFAQYGFVMPEVN